MCDTHEQSQHIPVCLHTTCHGISRDGSSMSSVGHLSTIYSSLLAHNTPWHSQISQLDTYRSWLASLTTHRMPALAAAPTQQLPRQQQWHTRGVRCMCRQYACTLFLFMQEHTLSSKSAAIGTCNLTVYMSTCLCLVCVLCVSLCVALCYLSPPLLTLAVLLRADGKDIVKKSSNRKNR